MQPDLNDKNMNVESMARKALKEEGVLSNLIDNLTTKNETVRYNCSKTLNLLCEEHPEVLYPKWDFFVELLNSDHTYWKLSVIPLLANLARIDTENKFEGIFEKFFGLLNDKSMIPAAWIADNSGKIAKAKPELQTRITDKLLSIDKTHHPPERRDLIKAGAIVSFDEYFEEAKDQKKILEFVKKQLSSKSPKTAKKATDFLKKHGIG
ncbi:MAG: hypothetical protein PVF66_00125 [Candidatus Aminicenantes bacterium]|jgi:hypothetical protein